MKKLLIIGLFLILTTQQAVAQGNNITVTCPTDGPCEMAPNSNDPLFYEINMLPGDTVTKTLTVINEDKVNACNLEILAYNERRTPSGSDFPTKLNSVIVKNGSPFLIGTIQAIYDNPQIDLDTIPANDEVTYEWTVTFDPTANNYYQLQQTIFDFNVVFSCGVEQEARLLLTKTNNRLGQDNSPGDEVIYTLEVTAVTDVRQVRVMDLPPQGIVYVPGSWTGVSVEPIYHSPGVWYLGDMTAGEVVTLTYAATISSDQNPGVYPDLAWTYGIDADSNIVKGNIDTGYFVGTDVIVVVPVVASATYSATQSGQVLGATTLPATGINILWLIGGLLCLLISGLGFKKYGFRLLIILVMMIMAHQDVMAAANLSIRLSQPKTPTNQKNLELSFVAMDLQNRPIDVSCYKKGPNESNFSMFGNSISLINGGTSELCPNTDSFINDKGNYEFKAVATNGVETVESSVITVDYQTDAADTPQNYNRTEIDECKNLIKFKTADDSRTVRVEIYRSDLTSFDANNSTRITSIDVGPNQDREYSDVIPDCNKTYYYAVRSFSQSGSGSSLVGDVVLTTSSVVQPAIAARLPTQVKPPQSEEGKVLGEQTMEEVIMEDATPSTSASTADDVVPEEMPQSEKNKWWLILAGAALLGLILLVIRKRGK